MNPTGNISIRKKTRKGRIAQEKVAKKESYMQGTTAKGESGDERIIQGTKAKGESGEEITYREQQHKKKVAKKEPYREH